MNTTFLSVISPVYKAEKILEKLVERLIEELEKITKNYEIILIEDASPDRSWEVIETICLKNNKIKGVKLSRNFGQHYAITAGLDIADGDFIVVIDCDLQDNPKYIDSMYKHALNGYDIVYTAKRKRNHSFFKNFTANLFYLVFNFLTNSQKANAQVGAFSLLTKKTVLAFREIKDYHRHYLMIVRSLGFKSITIEIEHEKRFEGKSSYTLSKLLKHAMDGITSQSDKLLKISITVGFIFCIGAIFWAFILLFLFFKRGALPGYTSLMAFMLLSTGIILMSIGVAGIYIGKIFEQVKNRPLYFIDKKINI